MSQKENKEFCIEILDRILKEFDNYAGSYSFGEYAEEAVCLEKNGFSWIVYEGERGKKYNIMAHPNCKDACLDLISRLAESDDIEKILKDIFDKECERENKVS